MDTLNSNGPGALALEPLTQGAAQELLTRSYSIRTVNRYKRVWEHLADFARAQGLPPNYTRELVLRFEQVYGIREGDMPLQRGQRWRRHLVFGIRVLDDFASTGTITRFRVETTGLREPVGMHKALREYEQYARERRHLRPTSLAERMHSIATFLDFLRTRGLESLDTLQAEDLSAFIRTRTAWKPTTVSGVSSDLRLFLKYLFMRDLLPRDLSSAIPSVRLARYAKVPSVWEPEHVERLLAVVDHYIHDLGDYRDHRIKLAKNYAPDRQVNLPHRIDGAAATPPEDCGGAPGYEDFIAAMADPAHEENADMISWVGRDRWDPNAFDTTDATAPLKNVKL